MMSILLSIMVKDLNTDSVISFSIASFILGVFVSSFFFIPPLVSIWLLVVGLGIYVSEKLYRGRIELSILFLLILIFGFSLGSFRYSLKDFYIEETPSEIGIVSNQPEARENGVRFLFKAENGERALVSSSSSSLYTDVSYGDKVRVSGSFEKPGVIEGEGVGRDFDYGKYLSKDDIYHVMYRAEVQIISANNGFWLKKYLFGIKDHFSQEARDILSEPYASLLLGLLVAGRDALPEDILEGFRRAGVIHIVVLSGFNIALVAEFLRRVFHHLGVFLKLNRVPLFSAIASVLGIGLFVIMTGGEATVVRAGIMALIVIVGRTLGKEYSASRALVMAGFLMVLENPKILVFDPSFQLSFLATLGLIYVLPILEEKLHFLPERFGFKEIVAQTLSTQLTVLPLLTYSMGDISLVSLPANILVLVVVPWVMLFGFIAILIGFVSNFLALPITYLTHLLLSWILNVSGFFGGLSFASLKTPPLSLWVVFLVYALGVYAIKRFRNSSQ